MTAIVRIKHTSINSGNYKTVVCDSVTVSGKKNNIKTPRANMTGALVEVQTQSFENPQYNISGIHLNSSTNFSYADILTLYRATFSGTNPAYLQITYGTATSLISADASGTVVEIPVILESFNLPISASDSKNAYMPIANIQLVETKVST